MKGLGDEVQWMMDGVFAFAGGMAGRNLTDCRRHWLAMAGETPSGLLCAWEAF